MGLHLPGVTHSGAELVDHSLGHGEGVLVGLWLPLTSVRTGQVDPELVRDPEETTPFT